MVQILLSPSPVSPAALRVVASPSNTNNLFILLHAKKFLMTKTPQTLESPTKK
jgi:hypothetical protein